MRDRPAAELRAENPLPRRLECAPAAHESRQTNGRRGASTLTQLAVMNCDSAASQEESPQMPCSDSSWRMISSAVVAWSAQSAASAPWP